MTSKRSTWIAAAVLAATTALVPLAGALADTVLGVHFVLPPGTQKTIPQNGSLLITQLGAPSGGDCQFNVAGASGQSVNYPPGSDVRGLVITAQATISNNGSNPCSFSGVIFISQPPSPILPFLQ